MSNLLSKKDSVFVSDLLREAKVNELDETLSTTRLNHLIDKGYERITLQLDLGGESPGYLEKDKHYREADAALLNVIYPTNLSKINTRRKEQVLKIVKKLAGPYGIKRYEKDNFSRQIFGSMILKPIPIKIRMQKEKRASFHQQKQNGFLTHGMQNQQQLFIKNQEKKSI
ncbi:hypothetical protein [Escherichia coli]|uniref:hypothetical protein n=1 Tax=Escherichia coli TaxID=562 RepID=UPI00254E1557|nr:hypothetical protein [Escherichia coli]